MLLRFLGRKFSTFQESQIIKSNLLSENKGITLIELNNPKKRNALSNQLMSELSDIINELKDSTPESEIRCIILKSKNPGMFCAGADLKERLNLTNNEVESVVNNLRTTFDCFYNLPIPTIACIDGPAFGGGLELALSCDLRIGSKKSLYGLTETSLGILPGAGGTQKLARIIGLARAKELIFTSRHVTCEEALKLGIINYLEESEEKNFEKALELARMIAKNGPIGVRSAKEAINLGYETDLKTGLNIERLCYKRIINTKDRIEGINSFLEKRKSQFSGN